MTHPEAVEAVAKAIRDFRHIPDAGDGYPAIRMGDDTDLARVAVDALVAAGWAPRAEVAEEIAAAIEAYPGARGPAIDDPRDPRRSGLDVARRIARDLGKAATT